MIDAISFIGPRIEPAIRDVVRAQGRHGAHYERWINLLDTDLNIPARLFFRGHHNGIHKLVITGAAGLGWRRTRRTIRTVFGSLSGVRISRLDRCVDLYGISVFSLVENCLVPRVQNIKMFRSRGGFSFYFQASKARTIVAYDKLAELRAKRNPRALTFVPTDTLTRLEVRLTGAALPYRRARNLPKYANVPAFEDLKVLSTHIDADPSKPSDFLRAAGLRSLIKMHGLQTVSKMFSPPYWSYLKTKFFDPSTRVELPDFDALEQKTTQDWFNDVFRFPRLPKRSSDEDD
jgi:hypothetical protein